MITVTKNYTDVIHRVMTYCVKMPIQGWKLKLRRKWYGEDTLFEFDIKGRGDSDCVRYKVTRRSVSGWVVYFEVAPMSENLSIQKTGALSVTEAELMASVSCVKYMLYARRILIPLELKFKFLMIIEIDNKGAVYLINNWIMGGINRHIETCQFFLRYMKEQGIFQATFISGDENEVGFFAKNLPSSLFENHLVKLNGEE